VNAACNSPRCRRGRAQLPCPPVLGVNRPLQRGGGGHDRDGREGPFLDRRPQCRLSIFYTQIDQRLFLCVPAGELDAESRQSRRGLQGRGVRDQRARSPITWTCTGASVTRTARSPTWKTRRHRQPGAARVEDPPSISARSIGQRSTWRSPTPSGRTEQGRRNCGSPYNYDLARPGLRWSRSAYRARSDKWSRHALVDRPTDEDAIPRNISPGRFLFRAVPRRYGVESCTVLMRRHSHWPARQKKEATKVPRAPKAVRASRPRACTTRRTSRTDLERTTDRPTRRSSGCLERGCVRKDEPFRTSSRALLVAPVLRARRCGALAFFQFATPRTRSSFRAEDALHALFITLASTSTGRRKPASRSAIGARSHWFRTIA